MQSRSHNIAAILGTVLLGSTSQALTVSVTHNEYYRNEVNLVSAGPGYFTENTTVNSSANSTQIRLTFTAAELEMLDFNSPPAVMLNYAPCGVRKTYSNGFLYRSYVSDEGQVALNFMTPSFSGNFSNQRFASNAIVDVDERQASLRMAFSKSSVSNSVPYRVPANSLPQHIVVENDSVSGSGSVKFPTILPLVPSQKTIVRTPFIVARFFHNLSLEIAANGNATTGTDRGDGSWTATLALVPGMNLISAEGGGAFPVGVRVFYDSLGGAHSAVLEDGLGHFAGVLNLAITTAVDENANSVAVKGVTAKVILDGNSFSFLSSTINGVLSSSTKVNGEPALMTIVRLEDGTLSGTVSFGGESFTIRGGRNVSDARYRPAALTGVMTARLSPPSRNGVFAGDSVAHISTRADGSVRMTGITANGSPFSAGGYLIEETVFAFTSRFGPKKNRGVISGQLDLSENMTEETSVTVSGRGTVQWPGDAQPEEFTAEGGTFIPGNKKAKTNSFTRSAGQGPIAVSPVLSLSRRASQALDFPLKLSSPTGLTPVTPTRELTISNADGNGFFSGKLFDPLASKWFKFAGVALQGSPTICGAGFVVDADGSQPLTIEITP